MGNLDYEFTTIGDVKKEIQKALESMLLEDTVLNQRYDATKMDQCYSWLVDQIQEAYIKNFGKKNGGIDISNEQCVMACRHYFLEELWKYQKEKPSKEKKELTPAEKTANIVKKHQKEAKKEEEQPKALQMNIFDLLAEEEKQDAQDI